jgi:hypothetical integral membrane protein (TIGR02206 family)
MTNETKPFEYEYYHEGFFGYSLEENFSYFSLAHILPILLLIGAIFLTYKYRAKLASWKGEEIFRFCLGAALIFNEAFYYWRLLYVGNGGSSVQDPMLTYLPFQVCEWSAYIAAFMLMKKSRHLFDICFYVCLSLGVIPFFTPAVIMYTGPAYARYYQFWIEHALPIYAVFYMIFVHNFKADYKKIYKPFAMLAVLATLAIIANNNIESANFMYLAKGTAGDSIANVLPQNIGVRLVLYLGILCALFTLLSLPQIIPQLKAWKKEKAALAKNAESLESAEKIETQITAEIAVTKNKE